MRLPPSSLSLSRTRVTAPSSPPRALSGGMKMPPWRAALTAVRTSRLPTRIPDALHSPPFLPPPFSDIPAASSGHTHAHTASVLALLPLHRRAAERREPPPLSSKPVCRVVARMSSSHPAAGLRSTAPPASSPEPSFASFILERVSRNPFLVGETPRSLRPASSQTAATEDAPSIPSVVDAAQRAVIAQASTSGTAATSSPASALAVTAVLQRALIDAPLLPVGSCHLLHELVWTNFLESAKASKQVGVYRRALQLYHARQAQASTTAPLQDQQPRTEMATSAHDGVLRNTTRGAAVDLFAASPLASSPTDSQQQSDQGSAGLLQTPEELSLALAGDVLQANMEQALMRLAASRKELQRGLAKLRRLLDGLRAYDAVPFEELARQEQKTISHLFTAVEAVPADGGAHSKSNRSRSDTVLAADADAIVDSGASAVLGEANSVAYRKRSREV
ncbi:hypothetical protein, conserved [Leishmania tarentolae]|uniref:Uncharacterized protein n=1 Tax=Leishmania tarentolae TaxID=5689 RepID=A0A640KDS2_LEITA|nr:hypothetical protein, conserved [Leishmania tarentolae]